MPGIHHRRRATSLVLLVVLLVGGLLGGCARVRAALALQPDDTVKGEIVIATPEKGPDDRGPTPTLPPELASDVDVSSYHQDGYTGSVLRFSSLTFEQVGRLGAVVDAGSGKVQFDVRRAGGRVLVGGAVDLTTVPVDKADFQLKINFPGQVVDTNGELDSSTVSWTFTPGEVGNISAVVAYQDPNAPSAVDWTLGLAGVVALLCGAVVLVARLTRNPPVKPPVP